MAAASGPNIVEDGLVLALDAGNPESFSSIGQQTYSSSGTYSWTCPEGVTSVSVVCVGAGGAGGSKGTQYVNGTPAQGGYGGGLGYKNNIAVTPGQSYTVVVGAAGQPPTQSSNDDGDPGGDSYFIDATTVKGGGGPGGLSGANASVGSHQTAAGYVGDGGGNGGRGGRGKPTDSSPLNPSGGGGGAGGYSGNGGDGGDANVSGVMNPGAAGSGGGGGGGSSADFNSPGYRTGSGGGGGVGLLGQGSSGGATSTPNGSGTYGGKGGSGGADAEDNPWVTGDTYLPGSDGALYGGGGGGQGILYGARPGAGGAVRIMWGSGRSYPSTNTANQFYDVSGKGNNPTLIGPTQNSANGGVFIFDGSDDYITIPASSNCDFGTGNFTIEGFFNKANAATNQVLLSSGKYYTQGYDGNWQLRIRNATQIAFNTYNGNMDLTFEGTDFSASTPINTWHHFALVREGTGTNQTKFYFDGVLVDSMTVSKSLSDAGSNGFLIGRWPGSSGYLNGYFSNLRVFKGKALTAAEVAQNYNALKGRYA